MQMCSRENPINVDRISQKPLANILAESFEQIISKINLYYD